MNLRPRNLTGRVIRVAMGVLCLLVTRGGEPGSAPAVFHFEVNREVPDGDLSGLADVRTLPSLGAEISRITVTLQLSPVGAGGFLGDLYATLSHVGGGYAVLLNRPGRSPELPFGYSDGVSARVTLADDALADIHQYRLTLHGSHAIPLSDSLTGLWQPDGRTTDPLEVISQDPRPARLGTFEGADSAGEWVLLVADVSGGGVHWLESWSLSITPVPEPRIVVLMGLLGLGWMTRRRWRRGSAGRPRAKVEAG